MSSKILIRTLAIALVIGTVAVAALLIRPSHREALPPPASTATQPIGKFIALEPPLPAPALGFTARSGEAKTLADFQGQVVLVNLWATWCAPCVEEMPALDRLQQKLGSSLTILAISEDRRGAEVVEPFIARIGVKHLGVYLDPKSAAIGAFGAQGLPTSYLIGKDGRILGKLEGEAKWDEPPMLATLERYVRGN